MIRGLVETRLFNQALVNHWDHCGLAAHVCRVPRSFDRDSKPVQHQKGSLRVNINTATIEELQALPGIGPAKARLIVANRPYQRVEDLAKLQGIGQRLATDLRPLIKVDGKTERLPSR
jgi:competence protein ComEA